MRIAAYISGYQPEAGGGYTFETDILDALLDIAAQSTLDLVLLCPAPHAGALAQRLTGTGIAVHPVRFGLRDRLVELLLREFAFVRAHGKFRSPVDRAADAAAADLVWFLGAGVRVVDRPYVTVVWDLQHRATPWFPELSAGGEWDVREVAYQWFLKRASVVVAGTAVGRTELERFYQVPSERVAILPHPTPRFALAAGQGRATAEDLIRLGVTRPFFIYPAQFWPHKNHINLVLAIAELSKRHGIDADLVLVGSDKGNRAHVMTVAAAAGVADRIRLPGFVSREDLITLYRGAVALAYVSWCGPENLPPLEAFALGCPVVATRIPGAEEQLGDAALLVDPGDPADIAAGLARIHNDAPLRADLIAWGLKRAHRWSAKDYVGGAIDSITRLEPILRCWRASRQPAPGTDRQ
jgi:glycosyltransferase involved in cell wall biosynthesis